MNSLIFKNLSDQEKAQLDQYSKTLDLGEESFVFQEGDRPQYTYVLLQGGVQVEKIDINGRRSIVNIFREPGTVFGEVYLYLGDHPYDYSCRVISDSRIYAIGREVFLEETSLGQKIKDNMLEILAHKAFYLNQKLLILSSFSLRQKIANYLLQNTSQTDLVRLNLNREELADYLGTTRPSLSRELKNMELDGLIGVARDQIQLRDRQGLEDLV